MEAINVLLIIVGFGAGMAVTMLLCPPRTRIIDRESEIVMPAEGHDEPFANRWQKMGFDDWTILGTYDPAKIPDEYARVEYSIGSRIAREARDAFDAAEQLGIW